MGLLLGIFAAFTIIGMITCIGTLSCIIARIINVFQRRNVRKSNNKCINNYIHRRRF